MCKIHCTGYAPCENGDWLLFAPGDGGNAPGYWVSLLVMGISLHVCVTIYIDVRLKFTNGEYKAQ